MVDFDTFSKSPTSGCREGQGLRSGEEDQEAAESSPWTTEPAPTGSSFQRIHDYYEPEELVGKTCVAITNLPPRPMMGIDSCGMLISAVHHENGEEKLHLLMVDPHIPAGAKLY